MPSPARYFGYVCRMGQDFPSYSARGAAIARKVRFNFSIVSNAPAEALVPADAHLKSRTLQPLRSPYRNTGTEQCYLRVHGDRRGSGRGAGGAPGGRMARGCRMMTSRDVKVLNGLGPARTLRVSGAAKPQQLLGPGKGHHGGASNGGPPLPWVPVSPKRKSSLPLAGSVT